MEHLISDVHQDRKTMTPTWTQRAMAAGICGTTLMIAACGGEAATDGGIAPSKVATADSVKADQEKFKSMAPGGYKGAPGAMPKK